jgi:hypothetical protein
MDLRPAAAAALFLALCTQRGVAEQRTATLGVSVRVIRTCAVQSGTASGTPVRLTCSRDATPGVVTGQSSAVTTPVLPMRTTSIQPIEVTTWGGLVPGPARGGLIPAEGTLPAAAPAPVDTSAALPATAQPTDRVATPIATAADPVVRPANASLPGRQAERQIVTINF